MIALSEGHLRFTLKSGIGIAHYNDGLPHMALGPGTPDLPLGTFVSQVRTRAIAARESYAVRAKSILDRLYHEYSLVPACT